MSTMQENKSEATWSGVRVGDVISTGWAVLRGVIENVDVNTRVVVCS